MGKTIGVFVDSDVIISAVISKTGAAHFLMNDDRADKYISDFSIEELDRVAQRLKLNATTLELLLDKTRAVDLGQSKAQIKQRFSRFASDENDTHVIAGAVAAEVKFLLTYNQRHYKIDLIKNEFNITVLTPAHFLQYLRSLES